MILTLSLELGYAKTAKSILPNFMTLILAKFCLLKAISNINNLILACWLMGNLQKEKHFLHYSMRQNCLK